MAQTIKSNDLVLKDRKSGLHNRLGFAHPFWYKPQENITVENKITTSEATRRCFRSDNYIKSSLCVGFNFVQDNIKQPNQNLIGFFINLTVDLAPAGSFFMLTNNPNPIRLGFFVSKESGSSHDNYA